MSDPDSDSVEFGLHPVTQADSALARSGGNSSETAERYRLEAFHQSRPLSFAIAYCMLGSAADAEDMLQETFIRWQQASELNIESPKALLVTLLSRDAIFYYEGFHGRMVARTVNVGSPQVTAKVITLEDMREVPAGFFDATAKGVDPQPLQTLLLDETSLRRNLLPMEPLAWPPVQDGPLEGNVTTIVVVDREER